MNGNAFIVAIAIDTSGKVPKLVTEIVSTIADVAIVVVPLIAVELYIAVKAILVEFESSVSFSQSYFSTPQPVVEPLETLVGPQVSLFLFVYF